MLFIFDAALGWLGYPSRPPVTAPPHYVRQVDTIDYRYELRANDRGLRYRTVPLHKPPGTRRILVLGDSMTEGTGVRDRDRWTDRLERRFSGAGGDEIQFINAGEAGTAPFRHGQKLFHLGLDYEPDAVLLALYFNDFSAGSALYEPAAMFPDHPGVRTTPVRTALHRLWPRLYVAVSASLLKLMEADRSDLVESVRHEAERRGLPPERFEAWRRAVPPELLEAAESGRLSPLILTAALTRPAYFSAAFDLDSAAARRLARGTFAQLDTIHAELRSQGIPLLVVLLPAVYQYAPDADERPKARIYAATGNPVRSAWRERPTALERAVADWAERAGLPFLDLAPAFRAAAPRNEAPLTHRVDDHWTAAGHAMAAGAIGDWLRTLPELSFLSD